MNCLALYSVLILLVPYITADVVDLNGNADFRSVNLRWKYRRDLPEVSTFVIKYCEDQAWGKYRCKNKVLNNNLINSVRETEQEKTYETKIDGLRMATNYTIEVHPLLLDPGRSSPQRARALGSNIWIQTKGFFARAINCLTDKSLVEIETGPNFGGKISVEGSIDPSCATHGDASSRRTTYQLTINHAICGSQMNSSAVKSFIIVQENLPILTHSTRRFMVVCNYVPETFTVRAGVNLPDYDNSAGSNLVPVDQDIEEVDPSELFDSANNLFNSRVGKQVGRALRFSSENKKEEPQKWAHMVLMVVLVMASLIGVSCAVGHFIRSARFRNRNDTTSEEPSAPTINANLSEVSQDFPEDLAESVNRESPATLTNFDVLADQRTNIYPEGPNTNAQINPIITDSILNDLHPLNFESDDPSILITTQNQPLLTGPSDLLGHQVVIHDSPGQIFTSPGDYTCSSIVPVPCPLIPSPTIVTSEIPYVFDNQSYFSQDVVPTIVLQERDLHTPLSDVDSFDDIESLNNSSCDVESDNDSVFTDSVAESSGIHQKSAGEQDSSVNGNMSKTLSVTSIDGVGVDWQLKDRNGFVYPDTAL